MLAHQPSTSGEKCDRIHDAVSSEFAGIAESHRPLIFRFLLSSLRDADVAETLTQDCLLKAHQNWATFRGNSSTRTWLMKIAINLQRDYWRKRRLQFWRRTCMNGVDLMDASNLLPGREISPEQRMLAREKVAKLWKVVDELRDRQRTIVLLRYVEELELTEIAAATGLRLATVKAHLSRALVKIRTALVTRQ